MRDFAVRAGRPSIHSVKFNRLGHQIRLLKLNRSRSVRIHSRTKCPSAKTLRRIIRREERSISIRTGAATAVDTIGRSNIREPLLSR